MLKRSSYLSLPERFYDLNSPMAARKAELILFNRDLLSELDIDENKYDDDELTQYFSGQKIFEGTQPFSQAYAGFQFGNPVYQLGDGRAHILGELADHDIQLKGSGATKFSRNGDGKSALGPVLREYIVSEAMHKLGVPTTRALCALASGEMVYRQDGPEPGGIFTRVAESHIRVGTFQYFLFRDDIDGIAKLLDYTINRHYPELTEIESVNDKCLQLLQNFTLKQARLIAKWKSFGFIHGVMNTDNFSLAGVTIDYGPCAFMDEFSQDKVFSFIDRYGRYCYKNQSEIAKWNILRFAECLIPLMPGDQKSNVQSIENTLSHSFSQFELEEQICFSAKLGISTCSDKSKVLINRFLKILENNKLDFTLSFKELNKVIKGEDDYFSGIDEFHSWSKEWQEQEIDEQLLDNANPIYIPRNHQIEIAIAAAYDGDYSYFHKLHQCLQNPYVSDERFKGLELAPKISERVKNTFCGT